MRAFVFCFLMISSLHLISQTTNNNSLEVQQKIVEEHVDKYGENHINTAKSYKDLGMIYFRAGDNNRALEYVYKALQIEEKNYEKHNANISDSHLKLSLIYIKIGYSEKADEHRKEAALRINIDTINHSLPENLQNKLNPIHYNIENYQYIDPRINTVGNAFIISWWILETLGGGTDRAPTLNTAKTKQEKVIRKVHKKLARKDYKEARRILEANTYTLTYPSARMNLGYYHNIARLYKYVGSHDAAMDVCKKGISTLKKQLSNDRRKISKTYDKITGKHTDKKSYLGRLYNLSGEIHHVNGNYTGAIEFYKKARVIWSEINDTENGIVIIYNNIGNAHYASGDYDKATRFYDSAYKVLELDRNNILLAETHSNKANLFYSMGDYKRALKFYKKSIKIIKANTRKKDQQRVKSYVGISNIHYVLGDFQEALEFQKKAIQILEKKFGENHQYTGLSYSKMGAIYYSLKDYKQALEFQEKAMEILSVSLKSNHIQKASVFNNFAITQLALGEYGEAMTYQEIAVGIIAKRLGNKHPETLEYKSNLAEIYKTVGRQTLTDSLYPKQ